LDGILVEKEKIEKERGREVGAGVKKTDIAWRPCYRRLHLRCFSDAEHVSTVSELPEYSA